MTDLIIDEQTIDVTVVEDVITLNVYGGGPSGAGASDVDDLTTESGTDGQYVNVATDGGLQYRDPADVLSDIGAETAGSAATVQGNLDTHEGDATNPHSVTAAQVGADESGSAAIVAGALSDHAALSTTAHGGIVADNDGRLADARTPTAHAESHATGQSDAIAPADIGAEETGVASGLMATHEAGTYTAGHELPLVAHNDDATLDSVFVAMAEAGLIEYAGEYGYIVLGLGDSKTIGVGDTDPTVGYLPVLAANVGLESTPRLAVSGSTVASMSTWVPANIGDQNRIPDYVLCNLGANDSSSLPAKSTWIADYSTIIDSVLAEWPDTQIYIAKPWVETQESACDTLAKWIDELVDSYGANVGHGPDERIFLENWGEYQTYSDGVHPNHAGYELTATEWENILVPPANKFMLRLFTVRNGTFDPSVTESGDSGVSWVIDGEATQTTPTPSFTLDGSLKTVDIYATNPERITGLSIAEKSLVQNSKLIQLTQFSGLTTLTIYGNGGLNLEGEVYDLPDSFASLLGWGCTNTTVHGSLCDAPAPMTSLYLDNSECAIGGGSEPIIAGGLATIALDNTAMTQSDADSILECLYMDWSTFTAATPSLSIAGGNPAPSGIFQDATPPTTGLEFAYKLINDPDATGNNKWSISYTAP